MWRISGHSIWKCPTSCRTHMVTSSAFLRDYGFLLGRPHATHKQSWFPEGRSFQWLWRNEIFAYLLISTNSVGTMYSFEIFLELWWHLKSKPQAAATREKNGKSPALKCAAAVCRWTCVNHLNSKDSGQEGIPRVMTFFTSYFTLSWHSTSKCRNSNQSNFSSLTYSSWYANDELQVAGNSRFLARKFAQPPIFCRRCNLSGMSLDFWAQLSITRVHFLSKNQFNQVCSKNWRRQRKCLTYAASPAHSGGLLKKRRAGPIMGQPWRPLTLSVAR